MRYFGGFEKPRYFSVFPFSRISGFEIRKQNFSKKEPLHSGSQLVDISKLGSNSKIKKFSYSFICGKGYSPPAGENSFLSTVCPPIEK